MRSGPFALTTAAALSIALLVSRAGVAGAREPESPDAAASFAGRRAAPAPAGLSAVVAASRVATATATATGTKSPFVLPPPRLVPPALPASLAAAGTLAFARSPSAASLAPAPPASTTPSASSAAAAAPTHLPPIDNFHEVRPGLYRGARPGEEGVRYLQQIGVKTIVNLESLPTASPFVMAREAAEARRLGINYVHIPLWTIGRVSDDRMKRILAALDDPKNQPAFVHCRFGNDRTGLVIGMERVTVDHWSPAAAYAEMRERGFHPAFLGLDHYFKRATSFDPHAGVRSRAALRERVAPAMVARVE